MWMVLPLAVPTVLAEQVAVSANLEGASILLDGQDTGLRTPAVLPDVPPGLHTFTVLQGCRRGEVEVRVAAGKTARLNILTVEESGSVEIRPLPADARITLGGAPVAPAVPISAACGSHELRVEAPNYTSALLTVDVTDLTPLILDVALEKPGFGGVDLSATPAGATLLLDGRPLGSGIITLPSVAAGLHTLSARADGYQDFQADVWITADQDVTFQIRLSRSEKRPGQLIPYGDLSQQAIDDAANPPAPATPKPAPVTAPATAPKPAPKPAPTPAPAPKPAPAPAPKPAPEEAVISAPADWLGEEPDDPPLDLDDPPPGAAPKPRAAKPAAEKPAAEKPAASHPARWAGVGLMSAGALAGAGGVVLYGQAVQDGRAAEAKLEAAEENRRFQDDAEEAQQEYNRSSNLFYGASLSAGLLLVGGTVCVLVDGDAAIPRFVPLPGGGFFLWSAPF